MSHGYMPQRNSILSIKEKRGIHKEGKEIEKSLKEKGEYEMLEEKKRKLKAAWDKAKPGWDKE